MTEYYKDMAIQELSRHRALQSSLCTLPEQIARLEQSLTDPVSVLGRGEPVRGSGYGGAQDRLADGMARKIRMERSLACARQAVSSVETAMEALTEPERMVLREFYIDRERGHMDRLCQELGVEEAAVYRLKNKALRRFTLAMYGPEGEGGLPS